MAMNDNQNEAGLTQEIMSRRKSLALLAATGVALTQISLSGVAQAQQTSVSGPGLLFNTVAAMQAAATLAVGTLAQTAGYFAAGDGGDGIYLVESVVAERIANGGDVIALANGLQAVLLEAHSVNYKLFGAVSDGKNDDGVQIKLAHEYAQRKKLPIINLNGEYWISKTNNIPINGDVQWGQSVFHLDERYNVRGIPRFRVFPAGERQKIELSETEKASFLAQLKPGVLTIPELAQYTNCLVQVLDEKDRIGFRQGYEGQSWAREELFYVDEHGRIIGDIAWQFSNYTQLNVTPCGNTYTVIEGGGFYVSGDDPDGESNGYHHNGFTIQRSRTIIRNQWVGLEKGKADVSIAARSGFYVFSHVFDVTLENIRLIPWEQNRSDPAKKVGMGTYGIGGSRMLNCTFRNVTAEGSWVHWGVFGTNVNKNFRIENCQLNRVDVHFHCWNLYIVDSVIGLRGISVTGGGHLWIENTVRHGNHFINFRSDFGAVWNGDINIRNCRMMLAGEGEAAIMRNRMADFEFGYPIGAARSISVEDLTIDYNGFPNAKAACWLMDIVPFGKTKTGRRLFFPSRVSFKNVQVVGRSQGVRLVQIQQPANYEMPNEGSYDGVLLETNTRLFFENVQLEKLPATAPQTSEQVHFRLGDTTSPAADKDSLYPAIRFADCDNLSLFLGDSIADISFERCGIDRLATVAGKPLKGRLVFDNCRFAPRIEGELQPIYLLDAELGTSFTNCTLHAPRIGDKLNAEFFDRLGIVQLNKIVRHNHSNTQLGNEVLKYCREKNIKLSQNFIAMLKSHHTLENDEVQGGSRA